MGDMIRITDKKYLMDKVLKNNYDHLVKAVGVNWDGVIVEDGVEGSGKTTNTDQGAYYCAWCNKRPYGIDNVVFTPEQFEKAVLTLPPGSSINWDEAVFGALGIEWANVVNRTIIKMFTTIRKKRLIIFVVIPWIFLLGPYLAAGRSRALIHTYTPDGISRGFFRLYNYKQKHELYFKNKRKFSYDGVESSYEGTFVDTTGLFYSKEEYEKKKDEAIKGINLNERAARMGQLVDQRNSLMKVVKRMGATHEEIADHVGLSTRQVKAIINDEKV